MDDLLEGVILLKKYDFPTEDNLVKMKNILKLGPKETMPGVTASEKKRVVDKFMLLTADGAEHVVSKESQLRVIHQSQCLDILSHFHDQAGHPGRQTVLKLIHETYHNIPRAIVEKYMFINRNINR